MNRDRIAEAKEYLKESIGIIEFLSIYVPDALRLPTFKINKAIEILNEELEADKHG